MSSKPPISGYGIPFVQTLVDGMPFKPFTRTLDFLNVPANFLAVDPVSEGITLDFSVISGGGGTANQSGFVNRTTDQTIANFADIQYNNEVRDPLGLFDGGVDNTRFIIPASLNGAIMQFSACFRMANIGATTLIRHVLGFSAVSTGRAVYEDTATTSNPGNQISMAPVEVATGDEIDTLIVGDASFDVLGNGETWMAYTLLEAPPS